MGGKGVVMNHPSKGCPQTGRGEAAAEGLDAMTTAELTEGLEALCETMSEENYNGVLVGAYLDALDRKAPVPYAPSAEESHAAFLRRIGGLSGEGGVRGRSRRASRRLFRGGLVAAVLVVCLFSGMVAAQAAGVDVFGSIARWTGSLFSFGGPQAGYATPAPSAAPQPELTEEYLESLLPVVPEGFEVEEHNLYINSSAAYCYTRFSNGSNYVAFSAEFASSRIDILYEKDERDVIRVNLNDTEYYIFDNNGLATAVWQLNGLECGIFSNLEKETIIGILINSYGEE